jgi:hypothetical protein
VLNKMEEVLPRRVLPLDARLAFDIAGYYHIAGDTARSREYSNDLIQTLEPIVAKRQKVQINYYSNYLMLFTTYLGLDMVDKASDVVNVIKEVYAGEQGVDGFIAQLNAQVQAKRTRTRSIQTREGYCDICQNLWISGGRMSLKSGPVQVGTVFP